MKSILRALLVVSFCFGGGALAQQAQTNAQQDDSSAASSEASPEQATEAERNTAPYDDKLLRLSEVLGSIHYLRALCGANEGAKWRERMSAIIVSEEPGPERKARLVAHFNRGYRAFDQTYDTCTPSALLAADRYLKEGVRLSTQITSRYGR